MEAVTTWTMLDQSGSGKVLPAALDGIQNTPAGKSVGVTTDPSTLVLHIDSNLDGHISQREFHRWFKDTKRLHDRVQKDWQNADENKDGFMTEAEYLASPMARHAKRNGGRKAPAREFSRMDSKNATKITKEEFLWYTSPDDFGSADRDHDKFLTFEEYKTAPFHFHDYENPSQRSLKREFTRGDMNKDNKMSLEEFNAQLRKARQEDLMEAGPDEEDDEGPEDDEMDGADQEDDWVDDDFPETEEELDENGSPIAKPGQKPARPRSIKQNDVKPLT